MQSLPKRLIAASLSILSTVLCEAGEIQFNAQIRPILTEHCLQCHGPDEAQRASDLRLDVEMDAKQYAIVPEAPEESVLMERVRSDDPDMRMPPPEFGNALSERQIALLGQWITEGGDYQRHWAFEPIKPPDIPDPASGGGTEVDRFVIAALEKRGLHLSPRVTRLQLIRRATYDLIGLPPAWEDVQTFVNDRSPDAFAKVVDRLLDSPRYGERWGRHWLDIARYADTHGGSAIGFTKFPFSYAYRDYVIKAFNDDLPYSRFVTEQLAADQLGLEEEDPALAALGFLTVGMQYRNPHDVIDDQIDVITRGLMGLTVACARCHDHKYDPIPTSDYYALYATLASSDQPDELPFAGTPPRTEAFRDYQAELSRRQVMYRDMARDQAEVMRGRIRMQVGLYLQELARGTPEQDLSEAFLSYRTDDLRPLVLNRWRDYLAAMSEDDPVFGPWVQLATVPPNDFQQRCDELLTAWNKENGDPESFAATHVLATAAPKWNPRVLMAIEQQQPTSLEDVAIVYGSLLADVHRQWLKALLNASLEAAVGGELIRDQDQRHAEINSVIDRQLRRHLYEPGSPTAVSDDVAVTLLNRTVRDSLNGKGNAIHNWHLTSPGSAPRAMALRENPSAGPFYVFRRGNPIDRGQLVRPHFLSALSASDPESFPAGQRRLALARRIVDPTNPLTPRVIVNWVWQHHFGDGLVRSPDNFGLRGELPTHPRLLDYLAASLIKDGWSLKKLHRRIMLSQTYQQGAIEDPESRIADPDNELLWRMPRRRLDLEAMRDAMLAVAGELDVSAIGGQPFDFFSKPVVPRRSIYAFVNRDIISSLASTFDGPNPNSCTAERPETTVPQQTLFALNSDFIQDRATALATSSATAENDRARVRLLYRRAFSRDPEREEFKTALQYVREEVGNGGRDTVGPDRWQQIAHVLLAANEFVFVD